MPSQYNIQIKITETQANALLDLIEEEIEEGDEDEPTRPSLLIAKRQLERGLASLEARLKRMEII